MSDSGAVRIDANMRRLTAPLLETLESSARLSESTSQMLRAASSPALESIQRQAAAISKATIQLGDMQRLLDSFAVSRSVLEPAIRAQEMALANTASIQALADSVLSSIPRRVFEVPRIDLDFLAGLRIAARQPLAKVAPRVRVRFEEVIEVAERAEAPETERDARGDAALVVGIVSIVVTLLEDPEGILRNAWEVSSFTGDLLVRVLTYLAASVAYLSGQ